MAWSNEWYEGFRNGTFATQLSGAWLLGHLNNWMRQKPPENGASLTCLMVLRQLGRFVPLDSNPIEHQDEAWKLIEYMTTRRDIQLQHFATIAAFRPTHHL
ncbi:ABC-type sugar transport system, periplasmic component [Vibrio vulnificus]|nr:ABC-type sugar transport system, periplasmic component [Vibrio vulnificus]